MKTLSDKDKLQIMNNVVEPLIKSLSPDTTASCIASTLKAYLNSGDAVNDEPEIKANTIYASGIAIKLFDYLMLRYED